MDPLDDEKENQIRKAHQKRKSKPPSIDTIEEWLANGYARATDGCKVEPDGECPHGCKSWLLIMGMI